MAKTSVTVTTNSVGLGKVAVYTEATDNPEFADEQTVSLQQSTSGPHTYYIYAKPGYNVNLKQDHAFNGWCKSWWRLYDTNPLVITLQDGEDFTIGASFGNAWPVIVKPDGQSMSGVIGTNAIGNSIKVITRMPDGITEGCVNAAYHFDGWYDEAGKLISADRTYCLDVTEQLTLTPRWSMTEGQFNGAGYYRISNMFQDYLRANSVAEVAISSASKYATSFGWLENPNRFSYKFTGWDAPTTTEINALADPSIIFYVDGDFNADNSTVMTGATLSAQGRNINESLKYNGETLKFDFAKSTTTQSQYNLLATFDDGKGSEKAYAAKWTYGRPETLYFGSLNQDMYADLYFESLSEENKDSNWFAAFPAEDMYFDGAYWCSMYTGFPYRCLDGVQAYYVCGLFEEDGAQVAGIVEIEDGIVPAATPVLLKCPTVIDTESYLARIGNYPTAANRLLPLAPTAELAQAAAKIASSNMLRGVYNLASDPAVNFNSATMKVFGCGSNSVGFYNLAEGTVLEANRAYLSTPGTSKSLVIKYVNDPAGITNVSVEDDAQQATYVNLHGMEVGADNLTPGVYVRCSAGKNEKVIIK